jgi:hypothetical protein
MYKTNPSLIRKCQALRKRGFTLGEIIKVVNLPKTTVYSYIENIQLPIKIKKRIQENHTKRINEFNRKRKGKCWPGRIVPKPKAWTDKLIFLVSHFMFDGTVRRGSCAYQNRNEILVDSVKDYIEIIFNLKPYSRFYKKSGVHRVSYHYVELEDYIRKRIQDLKRYIKTSSLREKKIFLQSFFDDEGCVLRRIEVKG